MVRHVTGSSAPLLADLPPWVSHVLAPNPGVMTLDGTNTWLLRAPGSDELVVVDPGPLHEGHLATVTASGPVTGILITHGHIDHTEGVQRLRELNPGARLLAPEGKIDAAGLVIEVLTTPGHSADSVTYLVTASGADGDATRAVFTGDTILGRGTTVVAHPDGDLRDYLASLERLAELGGPGQAPVPVLPGHGPALADLGSAARFYLEHRRGRLDQVRQALAAGVTTAPEVVALVYAEVDRALWPAAQKSVEAQLAYLREASREAPAASGREGSP